MRLFLLRKLRNVDMNSEILQSFFWCYTKSVLAFSFISYFGGLRVKNKSKFNNVLNLSSKIAGRRMCSLGDLYEQGVIAKILKVTDNTFHIPAPQYQIL